MNARYKNPDSDPRGPWTSDNPLRREFREYAFYEIITPAGRKVTPPPGSSWRFNKAEVPKLIAENRLWFGTDGKGVPRIKRFLSEVKDGIIAQTVWLQNNVGNTQEAKKEVIALNPDDIFDTPKPERLIQRILHIATNEGDLVLDSFLGSGTTAAAAHKMGRRWIGIEMGDHAATHCLPRLQKVLDGEQGGISKAVGWGPTAGSASALAAAASEDGKWQGGGGFRFMCLGEPVFDAQGRIHSAVRFATLAAFVWQQETGTAWHAAQARAGTPYLGTHADSAHGDEINYNINSKLLNIHVGKTTVLLPNAVHHTRADLFSPDAAQDAAPHTTPHVATHAAAHTATHAAADLTPYTAHNPAPRATAYYLLYNGILGDKRPASGNVLTHAVLDALLQLHANTAAPHAPLVVYGEACRLGAARLLHANVTFKHIPYDVKAR